MAPTSLDPPNIRLPGLHDAAGIASGRGQRTYIRLSATRLIALLVAAAAGAVQYRTDNFDFLGLVLLVAFAAAAAAEFILLRAQPERDWYSGRAVAESVKTLAWRFAVQGEPFGPSLTHG